MTHTIKSHAENERWETLKNCEICFPATAPLHNRIATLEAENERLKSIIIDLTLTRGEDENRIATLEAENARLTADAKLNGMAWNDNQAALNKQAEEIRTIKEAIEDVKYYVGNPSAWEHYDDGVSEKIRAILKAAGMA